MNIHQAEKMLVEATRKVALGYEGTLDFSYGYLMALLHSKQITKSDYLKLKKVHSNYRNGDSRWFIGHSGNVEVDEEGEITGNE